MSSKCFWNERFFPSSMLLWRKSLAEIDLFGFIVRLLADTSGRIDTVLISRPMSPSTPLHHETYWQRI